MTVLAIALFAQLAVAQRPVAPMPVTQRPVAQRLVSPVLSFPDATLDDTSAYRGYQTRFFRDAARNTLQVYIDQRSARVVHLFADADNASVGFTGRDAAGQTAALDWGAPDASVSATGRTRRFEHRLVAHTPTIHLGWFLLGSMRVERDFQYDQRPRDAFGTAPYAIKDVDRLIAALSGLPTAVQARHLARLHAPSLAGLRARLYPHPTLRRAGAQWVARVVQPSLDGRDTLTLELRADTAEVSATVAGDSLTLHAMRGSDVPFTVNVATTSQALTPLTRQQIFTPAFLAFLDSTVAHGAAGATSDTLAIRARRMERQVVGVELLVSREKLMAGLPTYATYFGRDMLMTALMMRPIWQHETLEAVIATALRKLGIHGDVSHEEALGGQAIRESGAEYATLITQYTDAVATHDRTAAAAKLARADTVLRDLRRVRENYYMIDDEYQFAIVVARWITDPAVSDASKRAFLRDTRDGGGTRADRLLSELALVTRVTAPYVASPVPANLISFAPREPSGWASASWRDSGAGYAGGRYAMDINTIWVPHALESVGQILAAMRQLGISTTRATAGDSPLAHYAKNPAALRDAIVTWRGATKHFIVALSADQVRAATMARLAAMPEDERGWWHSRAGTPAAISDSLTFLAVALDASGAPIGVANTDPATALFLGDSEGSTGAPTPGENANALRTVRLFGRPYPAGLFVDRIGPVVSNDAYATPAVWAAFVKDPYHGPRVVWGREANLFLLGVADRIARVQAAATAPDPAYISELRATMEKVRTAVEQSGFHTELWSYGFDRGQLGAMRYGSGADIQLWSTTDLAVQFVLSKMVR
jgi:hypothetical protein